MYVYIFREYADHQPLQLGVNFDINSFPISKKYDIAS